MIFHKKKRRFTLSLLSFALTWLLLTACSLFDPVSSDPASGPVIVLDAGHGGQDGGAVARDGTLEKDLNLSLTRDTAAILEILGVQPILTRSEDTDTDGDPNGFSKRDDILNRLKVAKQYPESLFISLHVNLSTSDRDKGFTVFYGTRHEQSKETAQAVWQAAADSGLCTRVRNFVPAPQTVYLQHNVPSPCLLVEFGFLSNEEDLALLQDAEYRQKIAFMLAQAVTQ